MQRSLQLSLRLAAWIWVALPLPGARASTLLFQTTDHQSVSAELYSLPGNPSPGDRLIVIAPGFAQDKDTRATNTLCKDLSSTSNVLCMDFRGTGDSSGFFLFGAKEYLDLDPVLAWAKERYRAVSLMGLSLGAYSALRAAASWPDRVAELFLVSCPTRVDDIVTSGDLVDFWIYFAQHPGTLEAMTGADPFFRWGMPFLAKPDGRELAESLAMPVHFLSGDVDHLVPPGMSRSVYERVPSEKTWDEMPDGHHAESMYLQHPQEFKNWVLGQAN